MNYSHRNTLSQVDSLLIKFVRVNETKICTTKTNKNQSKNNKLKVDDSMGIFKNIVFGQQFIN